MSKFYIILFSLFWVFISWNWYTCGIKGFCGDEKYGTATQDEASIENDKEVEVGFVKRGEDIVPASKNDETENIPIKQNEKDIVAKNNNRECSVYLKDYLKFGGDNDKNQVLKLKRFLNEVEGNNLELSPEFDLETLQAVKAFQKKYKDDVLVGPWGISNPTGMVFKSTKAKINSLYCSGNYDF